MSHFTTIQTTIMDIVALRAACKEQGAELVENAVARGYGSQTHKGDFVIRLKGPYDIAVKPLQQVLRYADLVNRDGAFWVEEPGLRIHFRLAGDADPRQVAFEITVQEQVFAPRKRGLGFIRDSGYHFDCAADGVPVPQRAMVSTNRGHHWILEKNVVRWATGNRTNVGGGRAEVPPRPERAHPPQYVPEHASRRGDLAGLLE
jgi:hypothetical protein